MRSLGTYTHTHTHTHARTHAHTHTHTHRRNVGREDCKQSPRILRFVSMYVLTIGECEDSCVKLRSQHYIITSKGGKDTYSLICVFVLLPGRLCAFLLLLGCVFVLVCVKSFCKKIKGLKLP